MKKTSLQDCITLGSKQDVKSEYVVINREWCKAGSFNIAYEGGFLEHIGDGFYKCKRIVADNLSLVIMSDYPAIM